MTKRAVSNAKKLQRKFLDRKLPPPHSEIFQKIIHFRADRLPLVLHLKKIALHFSSLSCNKNCCYICCIAYFSNCCVTSSSICWLSCIFFHMLVVLHLLPYVGCLPSTFPFLHLLPSTVLVLFLADDLMVPSWTESPSSPCLKRVWNSVRFSIGSSWWMKLGTDYEWSRKEIS